MAARELVTLINIIAEIIILMIDDSLVVMQWAIGTMFVIFNNSLGKTLIGAFAGACLAFFTNLWFLRRNLKQTDIASSYLALFTLRAQLDDFLNLRFAVRETIDKTYIVLALDNKMKEVPEWAFVKPVASIFSTLNVFDFKSLAFLLLTKEGRNAFVSLQLAQRVYSQLEMAHSSFNDSAQEVQRVLNAKYLPSESLTWQVLEGYLGLELSARMRDQQRDLLVHFERDQVLYSEAGKLLHQQIKKLTAKKETEEEKKRPTFDLRERLKLENLPPLPEVLRIYLNAVPIAVNW